MDTATNWTVGIGIAGLVVAAVLGVLQLRTKTRGTVNVDASRNRHRVHRNQTVVGRVDVNLPPFPVTFGPDDTVPEGEEEEDEDEGEEDAESVETSLHDGTVEVESGGRKVLRYTLEEDDEVEGMAEEINGRPFDFYVMTERNYARFVNDEDASTVIEEEDVVAVPIHFRVPKSGRWVFVFQAYAKQYDREIHLDLRRTAFS